MGRPAMRNWRDMSGSRAGGGTHRQGARIAEFEQRVAELSAHLAEHAEKLEADFLEFTPAAVKRSTGCLWSASAQRQVEVPVRDGGQPPRAHLPDQLLPGITRRQRPALAVRGQNHYPATAITNSHRLWESTASGAAARVAHSPRLLQYRPPSA